MAPREFVGPRAKGNLPPPSSNSPNNVIQTKSTTVCHKQGISTTKMNCDLENSFLLVYLSGPLIITHGPRGATLADPSLSGPARDQSKMTGTTSVAGTDYCFISLEFTPVCSGSPAAQCSVFRGQLFIPFAFCCMFFLRLFFTHLVSSNLSCNKCFKHI